MKRVRHSSLGLLAGTLALLLTACGDPTGISGASNAPSLELSASSGSGASLLVCPSRHDQSITKVIGPRGGTLRLGGSVVSIPAGAVSTPTEFTFALPASQFMLIDVSASGLEHYEFAKPVQMTINYARCSSNYKPGAFAAWHVDEQSGALLEFMGGVDDKHGKKVTFTTSHLSGYAIAE